MNPSDSKTFQAFNDFAGRVGELLQKSPLSDLEKNARQQLIAQLAKHGLVTREDYEIQVAMLARAQASLRDLEVRLAVLEAARDVPAEGQRAAPGEH